MSRWLAGAGAVAAIAAAAGPTAVRGQDAPRPGAIRGTVVSSLTGEPLGYTIVALVPHATRRFTDDSGTFAFTDLPPGRYGLLIRQLGYRPLDTTAVVEETPVTLHIALHPIAMELPAVTVVGEGACLTPGRPDPASAPELALLFDQLQENAARYRLLAELYPFRFWIARTLSDELSGGGTRVKSVDTVEYRSREHWRYAPGRLVRQRGDRRELLFPELPHLADSAFQRTHCFRFGGVDTLDGRERAVPGLRSVSVEVSFGEVVPFIVLPQHVTALSTWRRPRANIAGQGELQRLVRVEFLRPKAP